MLTVLHNCVYYPNRQIRSLTRIRKTKRQYSLEFINKNNHECDPGSKHV